MMRTIPKLKEEFEVDQITFGDGQCFSTACIQQIRRPDVNKSLDSRWQKYSWIMDPRAFKSQVRKFMQDNKHQKVKDLKIQLENFTGMSWKVYWSAKYIMKKSTWADHVFIQSSAWFLQKDIVIHQNIKSKPTTTISGNINDENIFHVISGPRLIHHSP